MSASEKQGPAAPDTWDSRYSAEGFAFGTEPNDFLKENSEYFAEGSVISFAEGEGRNAVYLASLGCSVTGIDSSTVACSKALKLAADCGVENQIIMHCADLADAVIEKETYDACILIFCHVSPQVRRVIHRKAFESLKPGGILLLEAYTPAQLAYNTGGPPIAEKLYSLKALKEDFSGMQFLIAEESIRIISEGRLHNGKSAVVRILARK